MADPTRIRALYEAYIETVETLERNRKPGEGLLGLKPGPADDPCHDRFADDLEAALAEYTAEEPSSEETSAVLEYIYTVPTEHREPISIYWMLVAVHGLTQPLIGRLSPADANRLAQLYAGAYRRWERLPAQKQALAALKKRAAS